MATITDIQGAQKDKQYFDSAKLKKPVDFHAIAEKPQDLLNSINTGKTDIKEALVIKILAILSLILSHYQ